MRVFPMGKVIQRHAKNFLRRRVIHRSSREQAPSARLASESNSGIAISQPFRSKEKGDVIGGRFPSLIFSFER